jgi:hypothetical protein
MKKMPIPPKTHKMPGGKTMPDAKMPKPKKGGGY